MIFTIPQNLMSFKNEEKSFQSNWNYDLTLLDCKAQNDPTLCGLANTATFLHSPETDRVKNFLNWKSINSEILNKLLFPIYLSPQLESFYNQNDFILGGELRCSQLDYFRILLFYL